MAFHDTMVFSGHRSGLRLKRSLLCGLIGCRLLEGTLGSLDNTRSFQLCLGYRRSGGRSNLGHISLMLLRNLRNHSNVQVVLDVFLHEHHIDLRELRVACRRRVTPAPVVIPDTARREGSRLLGRKRKVKVHGIWNKHGTTELRTRGLWAHWWGTPDNHGLLSGSPL